MPRRDPDTLPKYAIYFANERQPRAYLPAVDESDAIRHYCEIQPLALAGKDLLRAVPMNRRG